VEYAQIVAATERQSEVDTAQALLDRRRKALRRKRNGFSKMVEGWRTLDVEVVSGKPSRSDAAADDEDQDDERNRAGRSARPREEPALHLPLPSVRGGGDRGGRSSQTVLRRLLAASRDPDAADAPGALRGPAGPRAEAALR
jgi:hypothetical protein